MLKCSSALFPLCPQPPKLPQQSAPKPTRNHSILLRYKNLIRGPLRILRTGAARTALQEADLAFGLPGPEAHDPRSSFSGSRS